MTDSDSDEEEGPQYESQTTQHKGPVHMQFFADEKIVRVERIISSSWSLTAKQEDVRLEEQTTLFGGIFDRKASNPTYFLARIKVGGFHPADGTYDVEYLEDIIMNGIKDQQAKRISHAKIRDVPVDFRVFVFSIILSIINFVSDLYYITFASYKHDSLRWISLGLLFLPVVNFVVLDFSEFRTIIFVQFFWGIAENASRSVFQAIDSIRGQKVSADEVRKKLFLTTTAVTTFFENQAEILVCVGDADAKRLIGKLVTGVGIAPGTKVVAVRDQPAETTKPAEGDQPVETTKSAEGGVDKESLAAVDAKVRVVTLSCQAFSSGSSVTFHLVDPGAYHSSFEKIIEQHSLRHTRQFLLLPLAAFWDGVIYHCFSAAHYFLKSTMAMLWGIDMLSTLIFHTLLEFGSMLSCFLAKHETRKDASTAFGTVKEISEDGWCVVKWRHIIVKVTKTSEGTKITSRIKGPVFRISRRLHLVDLKLVDIKLGNEEKNRVDSECGQGFRNITDSVSDSIMSVFGAATESDATNSMSENSIKVSSKVKLRCFSEKKITSLMNSAYLERAVFQEQSLFDILFVMAQHRRVLFDVTVFNATDWDDAPKFPPIILSNCYFVCAVVSMYMGLGLVALLMALMKTAILITKLASLVLYPALLVFNVFSIVMLYLGGFFLSTLAFLMSIFSIVIVTVFTIHLKLFGFPVVGEKFFARKSDSNIALREMTTCIDSSALVLKDIQDTVVTVSNTVSAAWVCSDEAEGQGSVIVDTHALDPNIKALNRAIYSEMIFEAVPQLVVTCLNAALTGGEQSSVFIITILSSSITFVYNTLPYGYYIFYKDTFTSSKWKNQEGLNGICSKAYYFITEEISYRINRTPRFNVADMDPVTLGDPDRDFNLYAGLTALVIASVFLLFGLQIFYLDGPYPLGCFLMVVFGVCFGVTLYLFIECSDPNPKVKTPTSAPIAWMHAACPVIGKIWTASSHFLFSWAFLISTILFFMNRDGYSSVPSVLTAFAPVFIVALLFFASTLLLMINDAVEYFRGSETKFGGLKLMLFYAFTYLLWVVFAALVAYKLDFPVDSSWLPWRAVATVSFGLLISALCCHSAQYDDFGLNGYTGEISMFYITHEDKNLPAIWSEFLDCIRAISTRIFLSHLSPYALLYLILGIPFVIGFSAFAWAADVGLVLPSYAYFFSSQVWAFVAVILVAIVSSSERNYESCFSQTSYIRFICFISYLYYFVIIYWWQSMLVSFVASQTYSLVSSYSLVMIPTYLFLSGVACFHTLEFDVLLRNELIFQDRKPYTHHNTISFTVPTHRYIRNVIVSDKQSLARGVFDTIAVLSSTPITFPVGLVLFPQTAFHVTNHFLWMLSFAMSTILFFAYLDGYSLVPTCLTAFVPMFLNLLIALYSGIVVLGRALMAYVKKEPMQKNLRFCIRFFLMDVLWALFLAMVAYKLDYPVDSAWIQMRGVAGLSWVIVIVGWFGTFVAFDNLEHALFAYPLVRLYVTWGVPFVVGFSMYAWAKDVDVTFPTYAYFLMQQVWTPLSSFAEFFRIAEFFYASSDPTAYDPPLSRCTFFPILFGLWFSWWQSMLVVFVHDRTHAGLSSYCLALIPTFCALLLSSLCEHFPCHFVKAWDVYQELMSP